MEAGSGGPSRHGRSICIGDVVWSRSRSVTAGGTLGNDYALAAGFAVEDDRLPARFVRDGLGCVDPPLHAHLDRVEVVADGPDVAHAFGQFPSE